MDLLLKVKGEGFVVTLQGEGDLEKAKAAVSKAFDGLEVEGFTVEPVEMDGK